MEHAYKINSSSQAQTIEESHGAVTLTLSSPAIHNLREAIKFRELWLEVATNYINSLNLGSEKLLAKIINLLNGDDNNLHVDISVEDILGTKGEILEKIASSIESEIGGDRGEIKLQLKQRFIEMLDQRPWSPIINHIEIDREDRTYSFVDSSTPLNIHFAEEMPGAMNYGFSHEGGRSSASLKGSITSDERSSYVPNGWYTKLVGTNSEILFDGFRSGTLVQYGEVNPEVRNAATKNSTRQLVIAMALKKLTQLGDSEKRKILHEGKILKLNIASFDLQTWVPYSETPNSFDVERMTIEEQREALEQLNGIQQIAANQESLSDAVMSFNVEVNILTFNYPVHEKSFIHGIGWDGIVAQHNAQSVTLLLNAVDNFLTSELESVDQITKDKVVVIRDSLIELLSTKKYLLGENPYKLNALLLNLAYLIGYEIHYNCRSGKDRTGFLDAEAKLTAIQLEVGEGSIEAIQKPSPISAEDSDLLFTLLMNGAGPEIQRLNTGVSGSKLKPLTKGDLDMDPLVSRVGARRWKQFKGLSQYADT